MNDITFDEVLSAYYSCRKRKRNSNQQIEFEFNLESNLWELYLELKSEKYVPEFHIFFIVLKPKPREVWAASFKDRIVHHLLFNRIKFIEEDYIQTTYACIKQRGTLKAAKDVQKTFRKLWQQRSEYRVLQVDISNFYVSIDKDIIRTQLYPKIDNLTTIHLLNLFINQDPTKNFIYQGNEKLRLLIPESKSLLNKETGLPIGNLTSQFFANNYLNNFDWFCKNKITDYYFRYMDDLIFILPKEKSIQATLSMINDYLLKLNMRLNQKKTKHNKLENGVNYVGYIIKPFSIYIRNATKNRAKLAINPKSINSYFGMMIHLNCYNLRKSIAIKNDLKRSYYAKLIPPKTSP